MQLITLYVRKQNNQTTAKQLINFKVILLAQPQKKMYSNMFLYSARQHFLHFHWLWSCLDMLPRRNNFVKNLRD